MQFHPTGHKMVCGTAADLPPATGLFMTQGVQAVCCAYHAAQPQAERTEEFAKWTLTKITPVSRHSALYHFTSTDSVRGTPYTRGRGRTIWHKTWHTTLRAEGGPPHVERDYTPVSTWREWDDGECDFLVRVHASEADAASIHTRPLGSEVWLSKPKKSLSVPSLVPDASQYDMADALEHKGILLVLGGTSGIPVVSQVMQHTDTTTCFFSAPRVMGAEKGAPPPARPRAAPLQSPVHLLYACGPDDVPLTGELARWCAGGDGSRGRLGRLVLAISSAQEEQPAAFSPKEVGEAAGLEELEAMDNVSIVRGEESPLTSELLQSELTPLRALGHCRVVVSGPASFNVEVAEMLEEQCKVDPKAITILPGAR